MKKIMVGFASLIVFVTLACSLKVSGFHFVNINVTMNQDSESELTFIINDDYNKNAILEYEILVGSDIISFEKYEVITSVSKMVKESYVKVYSNNTTGYAEVKAYLKDDPKVSSTVQFNVEPHNVTGFIIQSETSYVYVDESIQLVGAILPTGIFESIKWEIVSGETKAAISPDGILYGLVGALTDAEYNSQKGSLVTVRATVLDSPFPYFTTERQFVIRNKEVSNVTITGKVFEMKIRESVQLGVSVLPATSYQKVLWTSSDTSIASVDSTGKVTTLRRGNVQIKATSFTDVNMYDVFDLTINPFELDHIRLLPSFVNSLEISRTLALNVGNQIEFVDKDNHVILLENFDLIGGNRYLPDGRLIRFDVSVSDINIASVNSSNFITFNIVSNYWNDGSFILNIELENVEEVSNIEHEITITGGVELNGIMSIYSKTGVLGANTQNVPIRYITLEQIESLALPIMMIAITSPSTTLPAYRTIIWESSNEVVATIDEQGVISFTGELGDTNIKASPKYTSSTSGVSREYTIRVVENEIEKTLISTLGSSYAPWSNITTNQYTYIFPANPRRIIELETAQSLETKIVVYANHTDNLYTSVKWYSSHPQAVEIDEITGELTFFEKISEVVITAELAYNSDVKISFTIEVR